MRQSTSTRLLTRLAWMLALAVSGTTAAFAQEAAPEELKVFDADLGPAFIDVHSYPPEYQAIYPTFAQRCSKCHTLARPINSSMTGDEWWSYVTRMSGKPGSGISPSTAEEIFRFLSYDSQVRARSTNAVDPTLAPFLAVSKELSGVARIAAGTKNVPTEPPLRLRLEGDRRLNLKDLFRDDGGQKLSRWTARAPN
ncbi:MAG: hypothetical protein KC729_17065, partial [Candidatus Eisenbacteria bacterium]|nr:hypothetical protein [Candidatus Eisenbacteria bacterium]